MSSAAAERVLDAAWEMGIRAFDTAEAYGDAASRLAAWIGRRSLAGEVDVTTKVQLLGRVPEPGRVRGALRRFAGSARLTLLSHEPSAGEAWERLAALANEGGARAGQSLYEPADIREAVGLPGLVAVQCAGNVVGRAALNACPSRGGVGFDFRSVYLQGLLLESQEAAERRVPGSGPLVRAVRLAAAEAGRPLAPLLVAAVLALRPPRDRVVLGVDAPEELEAIAAVPEIPTPLARSFAERVREAVEPLLAPHLIDPRQWPK